jgi:cell pole-organizing protein PopZ
MSKPELPGNQSLEEILASIRKTLHDDRPDEGLSKLDNMPSPVQDEPPAPANGSADTLPNRLADALNGTGNGHAEQDLTDLLASELPSPLQAPKPQIDNDTRDVPWFLSRSPLTGDGAAKPATAATARAEPRLPSAPASEEISLTRPETLRRSFPPLFGAGEASPARPADIPFDRPKPAEPVSATPARAETPIVPTPAVTEKILAAASPATLVQEPVAPVETKTRAAEPVAPVVEKAAVLPEPVVEVAPVVREAAVAEMGAAADVAATVEAAPMQAKPDAAAALQGEPLQEVIARLLEPVIQQWLEANLPGMVEAAIREEVERQFKKPRSELRI